MNDISNWYRETQFISFPYNHLTKSTEKMITYSDIKVAYRANHKLIRKSETYKWEFMK